MQFCRAGRPRPGLDALIPVLLLACTLSVAGCSSVSAADREFASAMEMSLKENGEIAGRFAEAYAAGDDTNATALARDLENRTAALLPAIARIRVSAARAPARDAYACGLKNATLGWGEMADAIALEQAGDADAAEIRLLCANNDLRRSIELYDEARGAMLR